MNRLIAALLLATSLSASAADDRKALLDIAPGPAILQMDVARMVSDAILVKEQNRVLVSGELNFTGPITVQSPAIKRLWIVLPDRIAELEPNPILYDAMKTLKFNAAFEGTVPRGSTYEIVAEFEFPGNQRVRLRTDGQCLGGMFMGTLEPGEKACPPGGR